MDSVRMERLAAQEQIAKQLGIPIAGGRVMAMETSAAGLEAEILALPVLTGGQALMQNPTTGANKFVFGISAFGGASQDEF